MTEYFQLLPHGSDYENHDYITYSHLIDIVTTTQLLDFQDTELKIIMLFSALTSSFQPLLQSYAKLS